MINGNFRIYLEEAIGHENALVAFSAFERPASVSIRINPFKRCSRIEGREIPWCRHGHILQDRPVFTLDPSFHAGAYYVQDSSSMFVGHLFREIVGGRPQVAGRKIRVLDLCAAPGGKTTDLAASLREMYGDDFLLVSNEVMKARVGVLADNVALWGDPNVVVTSDDPKAFASLPGFFDVILADVPCSGEGMFRKDEEAVKQWSEDNVALCQARQKRIVADVWPALAQDGVFIYSTCTFNRKENDENVRWIADELGADPVTQDKALPDMPGVLKTDMGYSLVPGLVEGEGQYCAALVRTSEVSVSSFASGSGRRTAPVPKGRKEDFPKVIYGLFDRKVHLAVKGEKIIAVPEYLKEELSMLEGALHVLASGCAAGMVKGKDFVPDADLALSLMLSSEAYQTVDVDRQTALAFLHRDAVSLPEAERGYVILRYEGVNIGFVKNIGSRCNNLHPQSRRIRMDIK